MRMMILAALSAATLACAHQPSQVRMLLDEETRAAEEAVRAERPAPVPAEPFPAITTGARLPALTEIDLQPDRKPPATQRPQTPQPIPEEPKPPR